MATWPVPNVAAAIVRYDGTVETVGDTDRPFHLASITKLLTSWVALVAIEEGSIALDAAVGQSGCTLRHLLSHAGGYPFEGSAPIAAPERRRIYSNAGIELAAEAVAHATEVPFATYFADALLQPLGMAATVLRASPAHGAVSTVRDMVGFVGEVISPTLLDASTVATASSTQFPELAGRVPGVGAFRPCPWGLGFEIHGAKRPHWMGTTNSPAAFGHFGGSGTMLWVDPVARISLVALTDRPFDEWATDALQLWPALSDAVVAEASG